MVSIKKKNFMNVLMIVILTQIQPKIKITVMNFLLIFNLLHGLIL